ncbi:MAG TPA: mycothiol system anti-sigma-R factor [Mycobacteriales bacterium]|nr:mycothiol system anti-sigma-R factor [Mycobacteriales bacterium]
MSCGSPHATDCAEVIEAVYLYLDGECDEEGRQNIRIHLDECAPCLRKYGVEQEVKTLVARCCGGDAAPDGLRERVLVRLQQVRVEIGHVEYRAD